jgi:hypothetical protein
VIIRRAHLGDDQLDREVEVLRKGRHPGVERLISVTDDGRESTVTSVVPDGPPLDRLHLSAGELAGVIAVVATTLADLHEIGIAHQDLSTDAVLVGADGLPVLTRFQSAISLAGPPRQWPHSPEADTDVAALAGMARALLFSSTPPDQAGLAPGGDHRRLGPANGRRRRRRHGDDPASGLQWAIQRTSSRGSTARKLAADIVTAVPRAALQSRAAVVTGEPEPGLEPDEEEKIATWLASEPGPRVIDLPQRTRARVWLAGAGIALALATMAGWVLSQVGTPRSVPAVRPLGKAPGGSGSPLAPARVTAMADPTYAGGLLTVGGVRYSVGQRGDIVAMGRWQCRPEQTLALVHPATGQVFVFSGWPSTGHRTTSVEVGVVSSVVALRAKAVGACDKLVADTAKGGTVELTPWTARD